MLKPIFKKYNKNPVLKTNYANMFPTVIEVQQYLEEPIDRYYMYLAAHKGQNIYLATSPKLEGPWKPFPNPVYSMKDAGLCDHISSPEIYFNCKEDLFNLYYHGLIKNYDEVSKKGTHNNLHYTGYAFSKDGVSFTTPKLNIIDLHEPIIKPKNKLSPYGTPTNSTILRPDASYLRIFKVKEYFYGIYKCWTKTYLVRSTDRIQWEAWQKNPLIESTKGKEFIHIRHVGVMMYENFVDIYYSTFEDRNSKKEVIKLARLNTKSNWKNWPIIKFGNVLDPTDIWEMNNLRDPFPIRYNDKIYLFYSGGGEKAIGLAIANDIKLPKNNH